MIFVFQIVKIYAAFNVYKPQIDADKSSIANENQIFLNTKNYDSGYLGRPTLYNYLDFEKSKVELEKSYNEVEVQFFGALNQILIDALYVLNNTYTIFGKETIPLETFSDSKTIGQFKKKLDHFIGDFLISDISVFNCNTKIELEFVYYVNFIFEYRTNEFLQVETAHKQLIENLKFADIKELFYTLLLSIKNVEAFESCNEFFGLITFVILAYPLNTSLEQYRTLLISLISYLKMLILEKQRENIILRNILIYHIKENIKGILCNWLHPNDFNREYIQITTLIMGTSNAKMWFNQFPVILILKERNAYYPKTFEAIFKGLNGTHPLSEIENDYLTCMKLLFAIENYLLGKVKQTFEKKEDE